MTKGRVLWLDIAKGMTIILMIMGHASIPQVLSNFIFAFHMPLFFIASGWCTVWSKHKFDMFVIKKIKALVIPFILYSLMVIIIGKVIGKDDLSLVSVLQNGWLGYALWFVPVLFVSMLFARAIMLLDVAWVRYVICGVFLLIGVSLKYYHVFLPWSISSVPYATCLLLLGSSLRKYQEYIDKPKLWIFISCMIVTFLISRKWRLDIAWNSIIPVGLLTVGAVSGTIMMFTLASWLSKNQFSANIFQAIGKETFVILAFSQIVGELIQFCCPCNKVVEYLLMIIFLFLFVLIKNGLNKLIGYKLL